MSGPAPPPTLQALLSGALPSFLLLYIGLYGAYGSESAYLPAFLQSHGLDDQQLGLVLAAGTVVRIVAGPALGRLADRLDARRRILVIVAAASGVASCTYLFAFGLLPLLAVMFVNSVATAALAPLADALALPASAGKGGFQYGWVRGAGSAAFVGGALLSGQLIGRFGQWTIIAASSVFFLFTAVCAARVRTASAPCPATEVSFTAAFRILWDIPVYRRLLFVVFLVIGSHALNDAFAVIAWKAAGYGSGAISVLWSEAVVAEVVVFFLIGPWLIARLGPGRAAGLSAVAGIVRWAVMGSTTSVPALACAQALHGLTFALLHLAAVGIITRTVPERLSATALTVYGTFALGIASALMTYASGYLYGWWGMHAFCIMAAICAAALPLVRGLGTAATPNEPGPAAAAP